MPQIRAKILLYDHKAPRVILLQSRLASLEKRNKISIAQMPQTPLTPDDIESEPDIVRGARRLVPDAI
jgi:hypothetical protein